jgi:CBS domain containing-hemolysin-like protein
MSVDWTTISLWAFWLALAGCFLTAVGSRSLREFSRAELEDLCQRRRKPDLVGQILRQREPAQLVLEGWMLLFLAVGAIGGWFVLWGHWPESTWNHRITLVLGVMLAVVGCAYWLPWALAQVWAAPLAYYLWPVWRRLAWLGRPLGAGARFFEVLFLRLAGRAERAEPEDALEEELRTVVSQGHREGILEAEAQQMIVSVIELADATVSKIMTPRTYAVCIPKSATWREMLQTVIQSGHTRLPVYERTRDDIVGILCVKDLLPLLSECAGEPGRHWSELLREPMFVPETKPVDDLLQQFQQTRSHMAIVLDEYGGFSGIVTLEDILEEIVGEIADESDREVQEEIRRIDDHTAEVLGRTRLDEINEKFRLHLPEDGEVETIGGLLFSELGRIPKVGDELQLGNVRLRVLEATHRRVEKVLIELLDGTLPLPDQE